MNVLNPGIKSDNSDKPGVWRVNASSVWVNVVGSQVNKVEGAAQKPGDKKQEVF